MCVTKYKYWRAIHDGDKVPRKVKKYFLGNRMSQSALNRLKKRVKIVLYKDTNRPSYPIIQFLPYAFCLNCGCDQYRGVYRPGYYPEVWNSYYCLRCGELVAYEDNCPFTHVLEEFLYDEYEKQNMSPENMPVWPVGEDNDISEFINSII